MTIAPHVPVDSPMSAVGSLLPAEWDDNQPLVTRDLSIMSTRELRVLCNQLFRSLQADFPPYGAPEDYALVAEELEQRQERARQQSDTAGPGGPAREKFRDHPSASRFEFFDDGVLAGYVKYDLRSGRLMLLETVVTSDYRGRGIESTLIQQALLNAHQRRLRTVPYCPQAQAFLTTNPQFTALIPAS